jgi:hypothetical protein
MMFVPSRQKYVKLFILILIAIGLVAAAQRSEVITLKYFRVVDKATYAKFPGKYERVVYRDSGREEEVYVERQPAHQIPATGIDSVIVRKEKKYGLSPEEKEAWQKSIKESLETKSRPKKREQETYPSGFFYSISFKFTRSAWQKKVLFNNKNVGNSFRMKLGGRDLGVALFGAPIEEDSQHDMEFTLYTMDNDANQIKEMLSPIKDKVIWE